MQGVQSFVESAFCGNKAVLGLQCSENTKTALVDSMYIFLKRPEFTKFTSELGSVSSRILLTGPPGMVKACSMSVNLSLPPDGVSWCCLNHFNQ